MEAKEKKNNWNTNRKNAEEDYLTTPISVLRYISEVEAALRQFSVVGRSEQLVCNCQGLWRSEEN
jgi:hypothetical protein